MRCFIGIDLSQDLKGKILEIQRNFKDLGVKLVEPENLHICLKFLGETENTSEAEEALEEVKKKFIPFKINLSGIGAFPSENYIKVLWIGVKEGINVLKGINELLSLKLGSNDKEYTTHLTIGRIKFVKDKVKLLEVFKKLKTVEVGEMDVKYVKLIKSDLEPSGPVYKTIKEVLLGEGQESS